MKAFILFSSLYLAQFIIYTTYLVFKLEDTYLSENLNVGQIFFLILTCTQTIFSVCLIWVIFNS